jgi:hypothetical protein
MVAIVAFDNGDTQKWKISDHSLPECMTTTSLNLFRGHSQIFALGHDELVLVHSGYGIFTITKNLEITSVSPSYVEQVPLVNAITSSCVLDHEHIVTGDISGTVTMYKIPAVRSPSPLGRCMHVTDVKTSIQAAKGKINSLVHCRDKRKLVYFASDDPQVLLGVVSLVFPSNWYWD